MKTDKPRYSRLSDIIDLVFYIQTKPQGVTLKEISLRYNVSRRTAERLRDAILNVLPQVDELESDTKEKRWGFTDCFNLKIATN